MAIWKYARTLSNGHNLRGFGLSFFDMLCTIVNSIEWAKKISGHSHLARKRDKRTLKGARWECPLIFFPHSILHNISKNERNQSKTSQVTRTCSWFEARNLDRMIVAYCIHFITISWYSVSKPLIIIFCLNFSPIELIIVAVLTSKVLDICINCAFIL